MNPEKRAVTRTRVELADFMYFCPKEVSEALLARELITRDLYRKASSTDNPTSVVGKIVSCLCDRVGLNPRALVDIVEVLLQIQGSDAVVKKLKDNYAQCGGTQALPSSAASTVEVSRPDYGLGVTRQEDQNVIGQELTVQNIMRFLKERDFPAGDAGKLGIGLGLPSGKVGQFKRENPDLEEMLMAVIGYWLRNDSDKSWDKLAKSLRYHCDCANLADEIQGKESLRPRADRKVNDCKIQGKKPAKSADDGVRKRTGQRSSIEDTGQKLAQNAAPEREKGGTNKCITVVVVVGAMVLLLGGVTTYIYINSGEPHVNHRTNRDHTDTPTSSGETHMDHRANKDHSDTSASSGGIGEANIVDHKTNGDRVGTSTSSDGCTEIRSSGDLEKVLVEVDIPYSKMCRDLGIRKSTCVTLKNDRDLRVDTMAPKYLEERERPCWEDIVDFLCQAMYKNTAWRVKKTYGISDQTYSKYCKVD